MNTSETLEHLAPALSALQGEIRDAHKDTQGHNYKYADLAQVLQIVRPLLAKHGLSVVQFPYNEGLDTVGVTTRLLHSSGEWLESSLALPLTAGRNMSPAQAGGSVITYARRYSLAAVIGITQEDNDGAVGAPRTEPLATKDQQAQIQIHMDAGNLDEQTTAWLQKHGDSITEAQAARLLKKVSA